MGREGAPAPRPCKERIGRSRGWAGALSFSDENFDAVDVCCVPNALKRYIARLGKFHLEPTSAKVMAELLPKQYFDIRFVINNEN